MKLALSSACRSINIHKRVNLFRMKTLDKVRELKYNYLFKQSTQNRSVVMNRQIENKAILFITTL